MSDNQQRIPEHETGHATLAQVQRDERAPVPKPSRTWRRAVTGVIIVLLAVVVGVGAGVRWHDTIRGWFGRHDHAHVGGAQAANGKKQLWTCGMHPQVIREEPGICPICHMKLEPLDVVQSGGSTMGGAATATGERKVKYWWDPMLNPPYISDKPGKSPMGMDLIPVYEDELSGGTVVKIDPVVVQNMGVRVAEVTRGPVGQEVRAVGYLDEVQPLVHDVNLRVSGWIEKLHADTEGQHLKKGEPLFDLYSPEVQVAVEELITAGKAVASLRPGADELARKTNQTLTQAARRKLELWGIDPQEIDKLARLDRAPPTVTFTSPITGHVTQKMVVEGAAVKAGDAVLRIVDHSTLWLDAQVYAQDLPFMKLGQKATASVESVPGKTFEGEVVFIHPHVDPMTRTATVRMALPNPSMTLRPGMYATAHITARLADEALLVPREAVIDTGARQIVFVSTGGGRFEPRKVEVGSSSSDGNVQVLAGLAPGETVVTSGQFLLDAESRMREAIQKHLASKLLADVTPGKDTVPGKQLKWSADVDKVFDEYLKIQKVLGAPQSADVKPIDAATLADAAQALVNATAGDLQQIPQKVFDTAKAMHGKPLAEQRKLYKSLSDAVVALADASPPSTAVADKLFVMYCPMTKAQWLQTSDVLANPYYATEMKQCGETKRTLETVAAR